MNDENINSSQKRHLSLANKFYRLSFYYLKKYRKNGRYYCRNIFMSLEEKKYF